MNRRNFLKQLSIVISAIATGFAIKPTKALVSDISRHITNHENTGVDFWQDFPNDFVLAHSQPPKVIYVNPGDSISDVISQASKGDTIIIGGGTYDENIAIDKALTAGGIQYQEYVFIYHKTNNC